MLFYKYLLILSCLFSPFTMAMDDRYERAKALRDGKVEGLSKDEQLALAEQIFLEYALKDNKMAMHNYALIQ